MKTKFNELCRAVMLLWQHRHEPSILHPLSIVGFYLLMLFLFLLSSTQLYFVLKLQHQRGTWFEMFREQMLNTATNWQNNLKDALWETIKNFNINSV